MTTPKHAPGETIRFRVAPWKHPNSAILTGVITKAKHDDIRGFDYYHITMQIKGETIDGLILESEIIEDNSEHLM